LAIICLVLMVVASLMAVRYASYKPAVFPVFLMIAGPLEFGVEAGVGMNLSAVWLLVLIVCAVLALLRMPGPRVRLSGIEMLYLVFLAWAVLGAYRAPDLMFSARMFLKLFFPFLVLLLARRAVLSGQFPEVKTAFKWMMISSFIAFLCVGGFTQRFAFAVVSLTASIFWACAAFADHAAIIGVVSLICWRVWGGKWYLVYGLLAGMSPVLAGIRTGLGAFFIGASVFILATFRKATAILMLAGCYILFGAAILFVPEMKAHMFHNAGSVDSGSIMKNPGDISLDNVNNSGRQMLWTTAMESLFDPDPLIGSGLGSVQQFMYTQKFTELKVIHSGYVELLCDTGLIGLGLYLLAVLVIMAKSVFILRRASEPGTRVAALAALCGYPALLVCMGFDNVINFVLVAGQYPAIFAGLAIGLAERATISRPTALSPLIVPRVQWSHFSQRH
jgi:O-antigen ligase